MLIFNLISYNTVCNTNTTTNANEIKALTRIESEKIKTSSEDGSIFILAAMMELSHFPPNKEKQSWWERGGC